MRARWRLHQRQILQQEAPYSLHNSQRTPRTSWIRRQNCAVVPQINVEVHKKEVETRKEWQIRGPSLLVCKEPLQACDEERSSTQRKRRQKNLQVHWGTMEQRWGIPSKPHCEKAIPSSLWNIGCSRTNTWGDDQELFYIPRHERKHMFIGKVVLRNAVSGDTNTRVDQEEYLSAGQASISWKRQKRWNNLRLSSSSKWKSDWWSLWSWKEHQGVPWVFSNFFFKGLLVPEKCRVLSTWWRYPQTTKTSFVLAACAHSSMRPTLHSPFLIKQSFWRQYSILFRRLCISLFVAWAWSTHLNIFGVQILCGIVLEIPACRKKNWRNFSSFSMSPLSADSVVTQHAHLLNCFYQKQLHPS